MKLDKQEILDRTDGGLEIFARLIPDLKIPVRRGHVFFSVLREEKSPSATLFRSSKSGWWLYKDFGDSKIAMNAIDLLMEVHKVDFTAALKLASDVANLMPSDFVKNPIPPEIVLMPDQDKSSELLVDYTSNFHTWAKSLGVPSDFLGSYGVGTFKVKGKPFTCYVFRNAQDKAINWKWMAYKPDGHRDKEIKPKSLIGKNPGEVYRLCLFGEHKLNGNESKTVCLVESEKSAVLAAWVYPSFIWLATAGLNGGQQADYTRLKLNDGRPVLVFCDADPARKIPKAYNILKAINANVHLVDLMPERTDKSDIADYISEGLRPEIIEPKSVWTTDENGGTVWQNPVPKWAMPEEVVEEPKPEKKEKAPFFLTVIDEEEDDETDWGAYYREERENQIKALIPKAAYKEKGNDPLKDALEFNLFECGGSTWAIQSKAVGQKVNYWKTHMANFTIRVLFHMEGKSRNSRLIAISNCYGKARCLETDTSNLASKGKFKEFTEGLGNYLFYGGEPELMNLKSKILLQEMECSIVEILGQHPDGFFGFSNGIYINGQWMPVDEKGIVSLKEKAFYIPSGNSNYASNSGMFTGEKKVKHNPTDVKFEEWAALHHQVFGDPGAVGMLFGIGCLFSDIVFQHFNFFPLLFLYGEGGSGKGELIRSIQYLFGTPQDPLHLSGNANTDKAKIREMAQYKNLVICLEEYRNGNENTVNMLKGLWDRFGYKRARMDGGFGTESVPINSGAMITGNDYPIDDPLLQRLVVLELNKNARTQEMVDAFYRLKAYQEAGITSITLQILDQRKMVAEKFRDTYMVSLGAIRTLMGETSITDRMASNMAVIETMFQILNPVFKFPFNLEGLREFMVGAMKRQNSKRDSGSETQKFWDVVLSMANRGDIKEGREVKFDGDKVQIRFTELHAQYLIGHRTMYGTVGLSKTTLLDKLKLSDAFLKVKDTVRFEESRTSALEFSLKKLGIDLAPAFDHQRKHNGGMPAAEPQPAPTASEPISPNVSDDDLPF